MTNKYFVFCLLVVLNYSEKTIEGWIYADNWFELYFNGVKVATDPITFTPHNAVKISFTAPDTGVYSYAFWAQDYADDITGLEYSNTCLGDGGIRISLSDGTISNSNWKCFVYMEGPINKDECGIGKATGANAGRNDCTDIGNTCKVQYNTLPTCWNQTTCDTSGSSWITASTYADDVVGWGSPPQQSDCGDSSIYPNGCDPRNVDWSQYGSSSFMWTGDLDYDNRIVCRYSYTADGTPTTTDDKKKNAPIIAISITIAVIVFLVVLFIVIKRCCWRTTVKGDHGFALMDNDHLETMTGAPTPGNEL